MESHVIKLTPAAHKYGNLNIASCGKDFFPPDAFGGPSKKTDLDTLRRLAANHDPAFFTVFPLRTEQERDRFDLLRQAYVGARYHDDYEITPQELKYLGRCVELLRDQTQTSCQEKMQTFT